MPSAGFRLYWVTVGPMFISDISTGTPKFSRVFLIIAELVIVSPAVALPLSVSNNSKGGVLYCSPLMTKPPRGTALVLSSRTGSSSFVVPSLIFGSTSFTLKLGRKIFLINDGSFSISNFSSFAVSFIFGPLTKCHKIKIPIRITAPKTILLTNPPNNLRNGQLKT